MYHQEIPCCCAGVPCLCRIPNKTLIQILKTPRHSFSFGFLAHCFLWVRQLRTLWLDEDGSSHCALADLDEPMSWCQLLVVCHFPKEHDAKAMRGGKIYINKQLGLGDRFGTHIFRENFFLFQAVKKSSCIRCCLFCASCFGDEVCEFGFQWLTHNQLPAPRQRPEERHRRNSRNRCWRTKGPPQKRGMAQWNCTPKSGSLNIVYTKEGLIFWVRLVPCSWAVPSWPLFDLKQSLAVLL